LIDRLRRAQTLRSGCESKRPAARLRTTDLAGELKIPFTSGILIGIGETRGRAAWIMPAFLLTFRRGEHSSISRHVSRVSAIWAISRKCCHFSSVFQYYSVVSRRFPALYRHFSRHLRLSARAFGIGIMGKFMSIIHRALPRGERLDALFAIRDSHRRHGHVQEVGPDR